MPMQQLLNCCHGGLQWVCSTQEGQPTTHEEIVGAQSAVYKSQFASSADEGKAQTTPASRPAAPLAPGAGDDKDSAKSRLQRLIRDFARDVVGPGLAIEAQSLGLERSTDEAGGGVALQALLRMDRRLSRIELWQPSASHGILEGSTATMSLPLNQVESIMKETAEPGADDRVLIVRQREGPTSLTGVRLIFDTLATRDKAYTCLRIFQMSVEQSPQNSRDVDNNSDMDMPDP